MAAFAKFYGFTPTEFRALTLDDFRHLSEYMSNHLKPRKGR